MLYNKGSKNTTLNRERINVIKNAHFLQTRSPHPTVIKLKLIISGMTQKGE